MNTEEKKILENIIVNAINTNPSFRVHSKGKGNACDLTLSAVEYLAFHASVAMALSDAEDTDGSTSPGGLPTALFVSMLPEDRRDEVGWNLADGWSQIKAERAFASKLVRKAGGGGNGGGNPALASKAAAFAGLVKAGTLDRATVIPLLATGKATTEDAEAALDKAIAKLA